MSFYLLHFPAKLWQQIFKFVKSNLSIIRARVPNIENIFSWLLLARVDTEDDLGLVFGARPAE